MDGSIVSRIKAGFDAPWVRSLVAFIIFVGIFWAGARFGEEYARPERDFGFDGSRAGTLVVTRGTGTGVSYVGTVTRASRGGNGLMRIESPQYSTQAGATSHQDAPAQ